MRALGCRQIPIRTLTHGGAGAGFNWVCGCAGQKSAGTLSLRVQQLEVTCETKSKDNVFVHLVVSIQYQVVREAIYDAFYKLTNSRTQITAYVFDVVRASVPKMDLDEIYVVRTSLITAQCMKLKGLCVNQGLYV